MTGNFDPEFSLSDTQEVLSVSEVFDARENEYTLETAFLSEPDWGYVDWLEKNEYWTDLEKYMYEISKLS